MDNELLKAMCAVVGPSGHEGGITEFIIERIKDYVDEYYLDPLGNLIAHKKGPGKKMMLAGHMDQIGMMITHIDKEGFLYFSRIGGLSPYNCHSRRVIFENGTVGVINCEQLDDMKGFSLDKLYIDIGAKNLDDARQYVSVGDICVYYDSAVIDAHKIVAPALDDRIGCFVMLEAAKRITKPAFDTYFVFTVQEEIGLRGAKASAYSVDPDFGISFDVTVAYDTPKAKKLPAKMGEGAAIKLKDASLICHPTIISHMERCAKEADIKYQYEILEAGGTDSGAIHLNKTGVPSGVISIATRYVHSASEMCSIADVESAIDLTVKVLETDI